MNYIFQNDRIKFPHLDHSTSKFEKIYSKNKIFTAKIHTEEEKPSKTEQEPWRAIRFNRFQSYASRLLIVIYCIGLMVVGVTIANMGEQEPPLQMDFPTTFEYKPKKEEIRIIKDRINQFIKNPKEGMTLSDSDLNCLLSLFNYSRNLRKNIIFRPIKEDGLLPVEVSLPLKGGGFFNCCCYYKLERKNDGNWKTSLCRLDPIISNALLGPATASFFDKNFLDLKNTEADDVLKFIFDGKLITSIKIAGGEIWINKEPEIHITEEKTENQIYETRRTSPPLEWVENLPILEPRESQIFSLFFRNILNKDLQ